MKKYIAAVCAVLVMIGLTACGSAGADSNIEQTTADTDISETAAVEEDSSETVSEPEQEIKTPACAEMTAEILENVEFPSMAEVGTDRAGLYLDCEIPEDSDFSMFICGSGGFADEVCVIRSASLDESVFEEAVEKRIESRKKDFEGYNPDEYDKLGDYYMEVFGDYFIYAVTPDNNICEGVFEKYVK